MKKTIICGAVIALCFACGGEDEGDGAVFIVSGGSPDCGPGNLLVYATRGDIFYSDEYGRNETRVTNTPLEAEWNPSWSPDGNNIAFDLYDRETLIRQIYVISKEGGAPRRLTTNGGRYPIWSSDGDYVAFISVEGGLWKVAVGGGSPTRLTTSKHCGTPCWSEDGERVYFSGPDPKEPMGPYFLWYVDPESLDVFRLWESEERFSELAIRPDGDWLAARLEIGSSPHDIWLLNVRTGKRYRLTRERERSEEFPSLGAFSPAWRKDGGRVFFSSDRSPSGIYGIDIAY